MLWIHREPVTKAGVRAARGARSVVIELSDELLEGFDEKALCELLSAGLTSTLYVVGTGQLERGFDAKAMDASTEALKAAHERLKLVHGQLLTAMETISMLEQRNAELEALGTDSPEEEEEELDQGTEAVTALLTYVVFEQLKATGVEIDPVMAEKIETILGL